MALNYSNLPFRHTFFSSRNSSTEMKKFQNLLRQAPLESQRTSVCRSKRLNFSSLSIHSSANYRSLRELQLILFTAEMTYCNDWCKCSLRFFATKCCVCITQYYISLVQSGMNFLNSTQFYFAVPASLLLSDNVRLRSPWIASLFYYCSVYVM